MTPDPIGLNGGINPYRYANANSINWIDPDGLFPANYKQIIKELKKGKSVPTNYPKHWVNNPRIPSPYNKESWTPKDLEWLENQGKELEDTAEVCENVADVMTEISMTAAEEAAKNAHPVLGVAVKAINFVIGATPAY